jgi:hypothetical protein
MDVGEFTNFVAAGKARAGRTVERTAFAGKGP